MVATVIANPAPRIGQLAILIPSSLSGAQDSHVWIRSTGDALAETSAVMLGPPL